MTAETDFHIAQAGKTGVVATQSFTATPVQVLAAFLDADWMKEWMGAPEMPLDVCDVDCRLGGRFRCAWTLPDGSKSWVAGVYDELTDTTIGHSELWRPDWTGGDTHVHRSVEPQENRTLMRTVITYATPEARSNALATMAAGMKNSWARLEALFQQ
jgi:uncharacterized protein YndB with AHSA1/START domain